MIFAVPGDRFFFKMLNKLVATMVTGIKNSINEVLMWMIFNALKASVIECPMVNAVTSISTLRQSLKI